LAQHLQCKAPVTDINEGVGNGKGNGKEGGNSSIKNDPEWIYRKKIKNSRGQRSLPTQGPQEGDFSKGSFCGIKNAPRWSNQRGIQKGGG